MTSFSPDELARYARHFSLPRFGIEAQQKLKEASVLLVGAGGLGSPSALYLAAAGIGRIGIVDFDDVDASNLQRQVIHSTATIGRPKVESARDRIVALNPHVQVVTYRESVGLDNVERLVAEHDIVIDGTDNFATRYLVNDACVFAKKPNVYGSVFRFEGQASLFDVGRGPCYRCLYPSPPAPGTVPSCEEGGVLGVVPGIIGLIQATEALKWITGVGETLVGKLLLFDALSMRFRQMKVPKNPNCPICGERPTIEKLILEEWSCEMDAVETTDITPRELADRIAKGDHPRLIDVREPFEWEIARLDGATLMPLKTLDVRLPELPKDEEIIVYCRTGGRSGRAAEYMRQQGFRKVRNLLGGIHRWSAEVDPSVRRY